VKLTFAFIYVSWYMGACAVYDVVRQRRRVFELVNRKRWHWILIELVGTVLTLGLLTWAYYSFWIRPKLVAVGGRRRRWTRLPRFWAKNLVSPRFWLHFLWGIVCLPFTILKVLFSPSSSGGSTYSGSSSVGSTKNSAGSSSTVSAFGGAKTRQRCGGGCDTSGYKTCMPCQGKGFKTSSTPRANDPYFIQDWCTSCGRTGKIKCQMCNGSGYRN
jgi:hypothetical protein